MVLALPAIGNWRACRVFERGMNALRSKDAQRGALMPSQSLHITTYRPEARRRLTGSLICIG
jgi:hypothetical protein